MNWLPMWPLTPTNSSPTWTTAPRLRRPPPRSTNSIPQRAGKPPPAPMARPPPEPRPLPTTKTLKRPCPPASTRKRRVCRKSFPSRIGSHEPGCRVKPHKQIKGRYLHLSLTSGNLLTLFLSLTYDPAPINFRLSPPHQRKSLGAKSTACRRQRDRPEHGPPHPYRCRLRSCHCQ